MKHFPQYAKLAKHIYFAFFATSVIPFEQEFLKLDRTVNADIYWAHDLPMLPVAANLAQDTTGKLVFDSHDFFLGQLGIPVKERLELDRYEKKLIGKTDLNITVNQPLAEMFAAKYSIGPPLVVYNSVDGEECKQKPFFFHKQLGLPAETKIVLYQGGFLPKRNLEKLIEVAMFLEPGIVVVLLGRGPLSTRLEKIARRHDILNKKLFLCRKFLMKCCSQPPQVQISG